MKIRGAVLREPNKPYSIEELELEPPKGKEALVNMSIQATVIPTSISRWARYR